jgi:hypothetical protein
LEEQTEWATTLCQAELESASFVSSLIRLLLNNALKTDKALEILHVFARDIHIVLGDNGDDLMTPKHDESETSCKSINQRTVKEVTNVVIATLDRLLSQIESIFTNIQQYIFNGTNRKKEKKNKGSRKDPEPESDARQTMVDKLYNRTQALIRILLELVKSQVQGQNAEGVVKLLIHLYQILHLFTRDLITNHSLPTTTYRSLLLDCAQQLNPAVYLLVLWIQENDNSITKLAKDSKLLPNLIFWIEKFETTDVIKLAKQSKIPLYDSFRRSAVRDFRIVASQLRKKLAEKSEEPSESSVSNEGPRNKRKQENTETVSENASKKHKAIMSSEDS